MPGTRGGGAEPGQVFTPSGLTRTLGAQYAAGGVVVLCWTALPWYAEASWRPVVALLGALSFVLGSVLLGLSRAALSRAQANLAANLAIASAELVVAVGWAATRDHRSPAIFFLLWTAAYAGLLSPRARWSHVAGTIALLVVAATTMPDPARALGDLIIFVSTVVVVTVAVSRIVSRLRTEATHDPLTGLANRRVFAARVTDRLRRREGEPLTVLLLDLDRFKDVNDTFGHATGDRLLVEVARRLERRLEPGELLARLGGDEFALVCWGSSAADPERVWQRLRPAWEQAVPTSGRLIHVGGSVGVATASDQDSAETLLRDADAAMYEAKRAGGGWRAFDAAAGAARARAVAVEAGLHGAVQRGELVLHYQPVVLLHDGSLAGAEALLRWRHPELGDESPAEFIPVAEASGLIGELGGFVRRTAVAQLARWRADGLVDTTFRMGVNVSPHELVPGLTGSLADLAALHGVPASALAVEVTESSTIAGQSATDVLRALHDLGVMLVLDDFGTGHSSLTHLRRHPFTVLKIDRSFVESVATSVQDQVVVAATASLARAIGARTVAEGIEDARQLGAVHAAGCELGQGFGIARPVPADQFPAAVRRLARSAPALLGPEVPAQSTR